jgi:endogenous inhibitor of DNA gyrase (YacG/DUF329 family)
MCENCGKEIKTTIFKGNPFCSDNCRRVLGHSIRGEDKPVNRN